jgi:hypothetical protein
MCGWCLDLGKTLKECTQQNQKKGQQPDFVSHFSLKFIYDFGSKNTKTKYI